MPSGAAIEARAHPDSDSSATVITEHLAQSLKLHDSQQNIDVSGITCVSPKSPAHSVVSLQVSPSRSSGNSITLSAIIVPTVTCGFLLSPVKFGSHWTHQANLSLADLDYGKPG